MRVPGRVAALAALLLLGLAGCTGASEVPPPSPSTEVPGSPALPVPTPSPTKVGPVTRVWSTERTRLAFPAQMTTDREGNLWLQEAGAMAVSKFSPDGRKLLQAGGLGTQDGQLDFHGQVHEFEGGLAASPAGELVVADGTPRLQRFDLEGRFLGKWELPPAKRKVAVVALDFGPSGELYVLRGGAVEVYGGDGKRVRSWGDRGPKQGRLQDPGAIVVDSREHVYVCDEGTGRVQKFDKDGKLLAGWGRHGTGKGEFGSDGTFADMAVDRQDNVYVVDKRNQRVVRFSGSGKLLDMWNTAGQDIGGFSPTGVAIDAEGAVYVADNDLGRLVKFTLD